jgi:protein TonB
MFRLMIFFMLNMASICTWAQSETVDSSGVPSTRQEDIKIEEPKPDPVMELFAVDQQPEFPNGTAALYQWLGQNIIYPEMARQKGIEGHVILIFVIEKDGTIGNIKVIKELGDGCTEEAIRVVKMMPIWKPGLKNGQVVRVNFTLPIKFKLTDNQGQKKGG